MKEPAVTNDIWWSEKPTRSAQASANNVFRGAGASSEIPVWRNAGLMVALMVAFGVSLGSLAGMGKHHDEQRQLTSQIGAASRTLQHSS